MSTITEYLLRGVMNLEKRKEELRLLQALPLEVKIKKTKQRIQEFVDIYGVDGVYISLSGKDSSVLLHIARQMYPSIKAMFVNTGLEYQSVVNHAKGTTNCNIEYPMVNFMEVLINYGYPIISKEVSECVANARKYVESGGTKYQSHWDKLNGLKVDASGNKSTFNCEKYLFLLDAPFLISPDCCNITKKAPAKSYEEKNDVHPIIGTLAEESGLRMTEWLQHSCNVFDSDRPTCKPLSIWTNQDILQYIKKYETKIPDVYGNLVYIDKHGFEYESTFDTSCKLKTTGCDRTGCTFCLFGITQDLNRIANLKIIEPKRYDFIMNGGEFNESGMWIPNKKGLGYRFVIDWINAKGNFNIKY